MVINWRVFVDEEERCPFTSDERSKAAKRCHVMSLRPANPRPAHLFSMLWLSVGWRYQRKSF